MTTRLYKALATCCFLAAMLWTNTTGDFIPNLTDSCYRCLCHVATRCQTSLGCTAGYCGPFNISRIYWIDAGKITLPEDDPERDDALAWKDCARHYNFSKRIVEGYLQKFGKVYKITTGTDGLTCSPRHGEETHKDCTNTQTTQTSVWPIQMLS